MTDLSRKTSPPAGTGPVAVAPVATGQRVLITQCDDFMGPALCEVFAEQGATVVADPRALSAPDAAQAAVQAALAGGPVDVLVANLAYAAPTTPAADVTDDEWNDVFAAYLCSHAADCFVGQVFPVSGGWAAR